MNVFILSL